MSMITLTVPLALNTFTAPVDDNFVITEFGVAELAGKTVRARAAALAAIAHPDFRAELEEAGQRWPA